MALWIFLILSIQGGGGWGGNGGALSKFDGQF